jgi:hypothetical protein
VTVECDEDIEAHFERSLGRDYTKHLAAAAANSSDVSGRCTRRPSPPPTVPVPAAVTAVGGRVHHHRRVATNVGQHDDQPNGGGPLTTASMSSESPEHDGSGGEGQGQGQGRLCSVSERNLADVSIAGSVDDHFTKSLGPMWNILKGGLDSRGANAVSDGDRTPPAVMTISPPPLLPPTATRVSATVLNSVDDHFAKALGDAWFKIKAEREKV